MASKPWEAVSELLCPGDMTVCKVLAISRSCVVRPFIQMVHFHMFGVVCSPLSVNLDYPHLQTHFRDSSAVPANSYHINYVQLALKGALLHSHPEIKGSREEADFYAMLSRSPNKGKTAAHDCHVIWLCACLRY